MAVFDSTEDVVIQGRLLLRGAVGTRLGGVLIDPAEQVITTSVAFPIDWASWREDGSAYNTNLPATGSSTFLGLYGGTHGTNPPSLQTADFKATTISRKARVMVKLPDRYVAASALTLRFGAGMLTTVADTSCTLAVAAYRIGKDYTIGSQLVATSATTINSLTAANKSYTLTATTLNPGDVLDVLITIAGVDAATGTVVNAAIFGADLICSIQG
jgi:hypothetical protein